MRAVARVFHLHFQDTLPMTSVSLIWAALLSGAVLIGGLSSASAEDAAAKLGPNATPIAF